ncbi:SEL1-like repeat protein [Magnetovibrio blakemorei]|uniref:Sel1 repeat family protein n=1 Tax=Magnetovibrio blakemorei TaxID=28181 RepID=A0A1E5Q9K0_9PROT|nr:sel1 repeat family protein [Magnetovibrio blakemorei]OEJ68091.1 hypothetical protein BEN30_07480 [Magnetovibrio blakemorei]
MFRSAVLYLSTFVLALVLGAGLPVLADDGYDAYQNGDFASARNIWLKTAYKDPYSAYNLGTLFETGKGGDADHKEAFKWYDEAARKARGDEMTALKRQVVLSMGRLVVKNKDADLISTAGMYLSTLAMKTGDPAALRIRGLLMEFQADHSIENDIANADNPMRFAYGLFTVAAERGSQKASEDAKRVWEKVDDKMAALNNTKLVRDELLRNGVN